jgi:DNA-binding HxlR family transcriptional regulator
MTRQGSEPLTPLAAGQFPSSEHAFNFADDACPARRALDLVADKWTPLVVLVLRSGKLRYNALRRALPGVSQRMLTRSLRRLEAEGLASRRVYDTVPPTVEYSLTPRGLTMVDPLIAIARWGQSTLPSR